jgi:methionyl-tRNA formyltransferase
VPVPPLSSVVFMGTPAFAVPCLEHLLEAGYPISAVYTQPPRPKGRGQHLHKSPIHLSADTQSIPVFTPPSLRRAVEGLQTLKPDLIVVVAYGQLLPPQVLALAPFGCVNVHASLLPRWRGAAPIQRALLAGDAQTGISLMRMDGGLDTGPVFSQISLPLSSHMTAPALLTDLSLLGARHLVEALPGYLAGTLLPVPQPQEGLTLAPKLKPHEGRLVWSEPAEVLERQVRALLGSGGAWFVRGGKRFKVLEAQHDTAPGDVLAPPGTLLDDGLLVACGGGSALRIVTLTPEGSRPMAASACVLGYGFLRKGEALGE